MSQRATLNLEFGGGESDRGDEVGIGDGGRAGRGRRPKRLYS